MPHFEMASQADQDFAVMEMYALWLSWLESCRAGDQPGEHPAWDPGAQPGVAGLTSQAGLPAQVMPFE
jgi:hypothetical protein